MRKHLDIDPADCTPQGAIGDAIENERRRIARELHDEVGQTLIAMGMHLESIRTLDGAERFAEQLAQCNELLARAIRQTRELTTDLHPVILQRLGLAAALEDSVRRLAARCAASLRFEAEPDLPRLHAANELAGLRIGQEALTNAVRHARARAIVVELRRCDGGLRISVSDDGCGFATDRAFSSTGDGNGFGLSTMRERACSAGARLEIRSAPRKGTTIEVDLPEAD